MTQPGGGSLGALFVDVRPGTSRFGPELSQQTVAAGNRAADAAGPGMGRRLAGHLGKALAVGTGVLAVSLTRGLAGAVKQASDLNETVSRANVVFGKSGADIQRWARNAASDMGQSTKAAIDGATTFALYGKAAGKAGSDLFNFSTDLTALASDMASFSNTSPEQAIEAIGAAMRGESDPIEQYGVLLNEAVLKNRAFKMGLIETTTKALTPQQRVLAVQAELFAQLGDKGSKALGDFERTQAGLANQQRIARAEITNLSAEIGQSLLPVAVRAVTVFNTRLIPAFRELWQENGPAIVAFLTTATTRFGDWVASIDRSDIDGWVNRTRAAFAAAAPVVSRFLENFREGGQQGISDTLKVTGVAMGFLADHVDLLGKALPYLVAALIAYKVAQLAANVAAVVAPAATIANAIASRQLAVANTQLAAAMTARTGTTVAATAATTGATVATGAASIATRAFGAAVRFALGPIGIIITVVGLLAAGIVWLYKNNETARKVIDTAWKYIKIAIKAVGDWIVGTLWPSLKKAYAQGETAVRFLVNVWRVQFNLARTIVSTVVSFVINTFNKVKNFITVTLPNAFRTGVANIRAVWDMLKETAAKPVRFVINTVFNGIGGVFNKIAGFLNLPSAIRFPTVRANFSGGGTFSGRLPGAPSAVDNMVGYGPNGEPIGLAGGEMVVNARQTAKYLPILKAINEGTLDGFADGGIIGFLKNPAGWIKSKATGAIGRIREFAGNSHIGQMLIGMADVVRDGIYDRVKSFLGGLLGGGGPGNGTGIFAGLTARMLVAAQQTIAATGMRMVSGLRPGATTVTGNRSYHASGRAGDFAPPSMRAFNIMHALFGGARELIYSPAGGRQIHNGRPHFYTGAVRNTHWDHIHLALLRGGRVPRFRSFDNGGLWPTGTVGVNTSGRTETVTSGQTMDDAVAALVAILAVLQRLAPDVAAAMLGMVGRSSQYARQYGNPMKVRSA